MFAKKRANVFRYLTAKIFRMEPYEFDDCSGLRKNREELIGQQADDALKLKEVSAELRDLLDVVRKR